LAGGETYAPTREHISIAYTNAEQEARAANAYAEPAAQQYPATNQQQATSSSRYDYGRSGLAQAANQERRIKKPKTSAPDDDF
jgi:hypothetical protein